MLDKSCAIFGLGEEVTDNGIVLDFLLCTVAFPDFPSFIEAGLFLLRRVEFFKAGVDSVKTCLVVLFLQ